MTKKEHYTDVLAILEAIKIDYIVDGNAEDNILKIIDKRIGYYRRKMKIDKDSEPVRRTTDG